MEKRAHLRRKVGLNLADADGHVIYSTAIEHHPTSHAAASIKWSEVDEISLFAPLCNTR